MLVKKLMCMYVCEGVYVYTHLRSLCIGHACVCVYWSYEGIACVYVNGCAMFRMFLVTLVQGYLKSDAGKKESIDDKQEFLAVIHLFLCYFCLHIYDGCQC